MPCSSDIFTKRPLAAMALVMAAGILIGRCFLNHMEGAALTVVGAAACCGFIYFRKRRIILLFVPLFLLLGIIRVHAVWAPKSQAVELIVQKGETLLITGEIIDISPPAENSAVTKTLLKTHRLVLNQVQSRQSLRLYAFIKDGEGLMPGQIVAIEGKLEHFEPQRNPGGYDEKFNLKNRGLDYKIFGEISGIGPVRKNLNYFLYQIQSKISLSIDTVFMEREAAMLKAMIIGDKSDLDESTVANYRKAGISHILAISGLHVSILAGTVYWLLKKCMGGYRQAAVLTMVFLVLYCLLTGASVSTIRAVWMFCMVLFGSLIFRTADILTSVAVSAMVILFFRPLNLFAPGFLLSYSAVLGLVILSPLITGRLGWAPEKLRQLLAPTLAASVATFPVTAYFFHSFSLAGIAVNILILPFAAILLVFGLTGALLGLIAVPAGRVFAGVAYVILGYYDKVTAVAAGAQWLQWNPGKVTVGFLIFYYGLVLMLACRPKGNKMWLKYHRQLIGGFALLTIAALIFPAFYRPHVKAVFLDVGQGDAAVIHCPGNQVVLVDGGGKILADIGKNTGVYQVYPYLQYEGVKKIDCIFLSHPDMDHAAGIIELLDLMPVKRLVLSGVDYGDHPVAQWVISLAEEKGCEVLQMSAGDSIKFGGLSFECLYPYENQPYTDINHTSMTLKMRYLDTSVLFTGDIELYDENLLVQAYGGDLKADIMKVPHHGSATSSTPEFVNAVMPEMGIVSSGKNNSYGHPAQSVLESYSAAKTKLYNTADTGAIQIVLRKNGRFEFQTMSERWR